MTVDHLVLNCPAKSSGFLPSELTADPGTGTNNQSTADQKSIFSGKM
jgi:hypothetical protein